MSTNQQRYNYFGFLYIAPWLIGFLIFQLYPFFSSLYYSFTDLNLFRAPRFIGFDNFIKIFTMDPDFYQSLKVTFIYVLYAVPAKLAMSLLIALALNQKMRGINAYRAIYYLPSILGGSVAIAILWRTLFMNEGIVNKCIAFFHIPPINWLGDPATSLFTISLLTVWQFGSSMVLFLAGLKQIPQELYEAGTVDGASKLRMFFCITIPQLTPILFFNLIMQMINAFQEFTAAFVVTNGGPLKSTYLYGLMIYQNGFQYMKMGYASALSWVLFGVIMLFTGLIFRTSSSWIHYEDGGNF